MSEILEKYTSNLIWYKQSCIVINAGKIIYFDPYRVADDAPKADFILVTHKHRDHFTTDSLKKIIKKETVILTPQSIFGFDENEIIQVLPNKTYEVSNIKITTVPAYSLDNVYHPLCANFVGYIVEIDNIRYYHAGDTDLIPDFNEISDIDVAFLPIGGVYTMDHNEALKAVEIIKPKVAIPIHFGMITGTYEEAEEFVANCSVPSKILKVSR